MKFGKVLKVSSENMPQEMHDLFLRYKELKKQIKLIPVGKEAAAGNEKQPSAPPPGNANTNNDGPEAPTAAMVLSWEEQAFIATLNEDLDRFNRYFIEKEEEAVIRLQALFDELTSAAAAAGLHLPPINISDNQVRADAPPHRALATAGLAVPAAAPAAAPQQQRRREAGSLSPSPGEAAAQPEAAAGQAKPQQQPEPQSRQQEPGQQQEQEPETHHRSHHPQNLQSWSPHVATLHAVKSRLVRFHGEVVLLLHWCMLNYAAVVKILKKHDKRTGVLLRAPYLANVLQQPFSSTTIMTRLAKRAEALVFATTQLDYGGSGGQAAEAAAGAVGAAAGTGPAQGPVGGAAAAAPLAAAPAAAAAGPSGDATSSLPGGGSDPIQRRPSGDVHAHNEPLVGSTMHALKTWANLRKNAITPSTVLSAEAEQQQQEEQQQQQQRGKRKAADPEALEADAGELGQESKTAKVNASPTD